MNPHDSVRRRLTRCSFCGRSNRETGMQVEGPNEVYICRRCVDVAQDIFAREREKPQPPTPAPQVAPDAPPPA